VTHDDAFIQAIIESPEEDTPRLVYADWLEERGDPRGEFVRVQCLLATLAADDGRRPPLEALERRLLERHQDEWLGPLRPLLSRWEFRRGFLDAISVPAATYLRHSPFPRPATARRLEVDLDGFEVPADADELMPESVAWENVLFPLGFRDTKFVLAMRDPHDTDLMDKLRFIFNRDIEAVAAAESQLAGAIRRRYGEPEPGGAEPTLTGVFASTQTLTPDEGDLGSWVNDNRAARLLGRIIATGIARHAREVRIEPRAEGIRVRYACDDGPAEGAIAPPQLLGPLATRVRIMAGIWLGDPREVQAGTIRLTVRGRGIDVGVVIRRTDGGPAVVLMFRR
jgi:uncharacterized protein (TIGR02996 family)